MNGPLFRLLLRRHRVSIGLFGLVPILLGLVIGFIYPTFAAERKLAQALSSFTNFLGQGQMDVISPRGIFTMSFQHPLLLLFFAIVVAIPATGLPAGERGRKALDLLCAAPLSRHRIMGTVTGVIVIAAAVMGAAGMAGAFVGALVSGELGSDVPWLALAATAFNVMALAICLGGAALLASAYAADRGTASTWYGVGVVIAFVIDVTARMWKQGDWLTWFTPYGFLRPSAAVSIQGSPIHALTDSAMLLGMAAVLYAWAFVAAERRTSV